MPLEAGFATLNQFKNRLGILDVTDDALINEIIRSVSGAMEADAGRRLRRKHVNVERFRGGTEIVRLGVSPVVQIHSVRESETRDFKTAANYTELVEGTDYIIEPGEDGEQEGESGWVRRLGVTWMGSETQPGKTRIIYTGGYKTDEEVAIETLSRTGDPGDIGGPPGIAGSSVATAYQVIKTTSGSNVTHHLYNAIGPTDALQFGQENSLTEVDRFVIRLDISSTIMPTWEQITLEIVLALQTPAGPNINIDVLLMDSEYDPETLKAKELFDSFTNAKLLATLAYTGGLASTPIALCQWRNDDDFELMRKSIRRGFIAFGLKTTSVAVATIINVLSPSLLVSYKLQGNDFFPMPDDLRGACLTQAIHDYQNRREPGLTSSSQRGVAIASGSSKIKRPAELLPEVLDVCRRYRRIV